MIQFDLLVFHSGWTAGLKSGFDICITDADGQPLKTDAGVEISFKMRHLVHCHGGAEDVSAKVCSVFVMSLEKWSFYILSNRYMWNNLLMSLRMMY